jgi:signal transduction histidine kinase
MDALQPWLAAPGIALGSGLLAAAATRALGLRALRGRVRASARDLDAAVAQARPEDPLQPLLAAVQTRLCEARTRIDQGEAQRRRMSADMLRLMQQGDGAVRARDRLLAATSHDLRQPLQAMDLALEQLARDALPAQRLPLGQLQAGLRTIADVLDGLLLLGQLEAGSLQPQAAPCELRRLFEELAGAQAQAAHAAGVRIACRAGAHAALTDAGMLAGLLGRLLDNAIRATPQGGTVLLAARGRGDAVRIEVRDNGIGIAPVHQPRVFDEFFQVGNPERDRRKGYGLGLAIVSRLATLLGTRVELRSRLHGGSCFWLDLPRASPVRRAPRILLREHDPALRGALVRTLAGWGFDVVEDDGAAGNTVDADQLLDAVLCTVRDATEDDWARLAATDPLTARIALCTAPSPDVLEAAARNHAHLLPRPPPPAKLRALLARWVATDADARAGGG